MIFDDYDNVSSNQITVTPNSQHEPDLGTSLDNFMAERKDRIKKSDYVHCYDLYQIHINTTFIAGPSALKRSTNMLGKRQSIAASTVKKKKRGGNYLLLLTDRKQKNANENESGIEESALSVQNGRSANFSNHSNENSVARPDDDGALSADSGDGLTLENEASIHQRTRADDAAQLIGSNKVGFRSLNWSMKAIGRNRALERSKSTGQKSRDSRLDEEVQLESFVSLDEIVNKPKSIKAEEETCAICDREYVLKDFIARLCSCSHIFHKFCIDDHIKRSDPDNLLCPQCRASI